MRFKPISNGVFEFLIVSEMLSPKPLFHCSEQIQIIRSLFQTVGRLLKYIPIKFLQNLFCTYSSVKTRVIVRKHKSRTQ